MSSSNRSSDCSPKQELQNYCASQSIEMQFCQWPELRFELIQGQFLVGGTLEGSRWLLKEALLGWGLESAIASAPVEQWWEALRLAYEVAYDDETDWLNWAEDLPLSSTYREDFNSPLGSKYTGENRWVRDYLRQALSFAQESGKTFLSGCKYWKVTGDHVARAHKNA